MDYYYSEVRLLEYRIPLSQLLLLIQLFPFLKKITSHDFILMLCCLILFKSYDKLTQQCKN